jgi:hypothetical protein
VNKEQGDVVRLFIDTEFNDFFDCGLISIGIVSADGREFYAERSDVDVLLCSDFARAAILPLLGSEPAIIGTEQDISTALWKWLAQFDQVEVCFDDPADFEWFHYLARDRETVASSERIKARNICGELAAVDVERYWQENGRRAHHALHDARANRFAFMCSIQATQGDPVIV